MKRSKSAMLPLPSLRNGRPKTKLERKRALLKQGRSIINPPRQSLGLMASHVTSRPMSVSEATVVVETARDRHLFGPGPKRILALDGGGVRGAMAVAFLERVEQLLGDVVCRLLLEKK